MNIEAEVRSFISQDQYFSLLDFFTKHANLIKEDYQETIYFDAPQDLRIQKNNFGAKLILKKGKLHDDSREELEVEIPASDFEKLESIFVALGYNVQIKWFRTRYQFEWDGITVCLDDTKGYGYIIELEKMCTKETQEEEHTKLLEKLSRLNITLTPKEDFVKKFDFYKQNWKQLTK